MSGILQAESALLTGTLSHFMVAFAAICLGDAGR